MESKFKVGDCVQMNHGEGQQMNVQEVSFNPIENCFDISCAWTVKGKPEFRTYKEDILKHCVTQEDKMRVANEIFPPRNMG